MNDKDYIKQLEAKNAALTEGILLGEAIQQGLVISLGEAMTPERYATFCNGLADILEREIAGINSRYEARVAA